MEVKSCDLNDPWFCIWSEAEKFYVQDMQVIKQLILSDTQLTWFVENILEIL